MKVGVYLMISSYKASLMPIEKISYTSEVVTFSFHFNIEVWHSGRDKGIKRILQVFDCEKVLLKSLYTNCER